jgi:citrate synthase
MSTGTLFVLDSRTGFKYDIPIRRNAVRALDLQRIRAPGGTAHPADQIPRGLRVFDPGLQNTAVQESAISFSLAIPCFHKHLPLLIKCLGTMTRIL